MNKVALTFMLSLMICAAHAQIYRWTDGQGNVHFSDTPHEGAETIEMPEAQTFSRPPLPQFQIAPAPADASEKKDTVYTKIEIMQPKNEETIRSSQGYIAVAVQVEPGLKPGDSLQLMFDGAALGEPQVNPLFQLSGIYRGAHNITVHIQDANGNVLATSDPITVFMQNPRVGMGNNGGAR